MQFFYEKTCISPKNVLSLHVISVEMAHAVRRITSGSQTCSPPCAQADKDGKGHLSYRMFSFFCFCSCNRVPSPMYDVCRNIALQKNMAPENFNFWEERSTSEYSLLKRSFGTCTRIVSARGGCSSPHTNCKWSLTYWLGTVGRIFRHRLCRNSSNRFTPRGYSHEQTPSITSSQL